VAELPIFEDPFVLERPLRNDEITEVGIVEGAAGIALTLLAAATDVEPAWDRMFLLSIPQRQNLAP
jgi:hypothetical protein